jgi:DNA-binding NarL/FixJ family response regulator
MSQIRIVIVDDHEIIHNGITNILKSESSYEIVGHAFNGEDAVKLATELIPDVIFMDISMPVLNGIEAIKQIKTIQNHIKIIALTQHNDSEYIQQVLIAEGDGYLLKNSKKEEFIEAIKTVLENKRFLSYEVSDLLINSSLQTKKETDEEKIRLTSREIEIIKKIADDKSNQEIANELFISLRTVETHRRNLMQKLKVNSIVALLKYAAKQNIIKL